MDTKMTILSLLLFLFVGLFDFFGLILIERLLRRDKNKRWFYVLAAAFNGALSCMLITNGKLWVAYLAAFVVMLAEIIWIFKAEATVMLFGAMAVLSSSMCLHGIVASVTAWACGVPFAELTAYGYLRLFVPMVTSFLEFIAVLLILRFSKLDSIVAALRLPKQKTFLLTWMTLCTLFIFGNLDIYTLEGVYRQVYANQLMLCLVLFTSGFYMLVNSVRITESMDVIIKNRKLSTELDNQKMLQSAFLRDSAFYIEVNLTKNRIMNGAESYMSSFSAANFDYSMWLRNYFPRIHPDDMTCFKNLVNSENLMEMAQAGIEPSTFIYRRFDGEKYRWVKMNIRLFHNEETNEIMGFGYSFDVDSDFRREKALIEKAKTDTFTGLLNKATTQSMIREQVRHGAGALFLMDIDNFKKVNDTMGHETGDGILKFVAITFKAVFSDTDIVGRVGGDEFMAFCAADRTTQDVSVRAEKLFRALADTENPARPNFDFSVSLGIAIISKLTPDFSTAYRQTDMALYNVKHSGKNSYSIYNDSQTLFDYA